MYISTILHIIIHNEDRASIFYEFTKKGGKDKLSVPEMVEVTVYYRFDSHICIYSSINRSMSNFISCVYCVLCTICFI